MTAEQLLPQTIDDYIAGAPEDVQPILQQIRQTIREAAPGAEELLSYQMLAFRQNGMLVYIGAFKKHIGLYPPVVGDEQLVAEASIYAGPKGNLRFPLGQPIPLDLISRIVKFRVTENLARIDAKPKKKYAQKTRSTANQQINQPADEWPKGVGKPAQRALVAAGYLQLADLTSVTEAELLQLHGMGPKTVTLLSKALLSMSLSFAQEG